MLDALAETEYGRLQHFKVIRPEQHDLTTRVKIEVTFNGAKIADWAEVNVPEKVTIFVSGVGVSESECNPESGVAGPRARGT